MEESRKKKRTLAEEILELNDFSAPSMDLEHMDSLDVEFKGGENPITEDARKMGLVPATPEARKRLAPLDLGPQYRTKRISRADVMASSSGSGSEGDGADSSDVEEVEESESRLEDEDEAGDSGSKEEEEEEEEDDEESEGEQVEGLKLMRSDKSSARARADRRLLQRWERLLELRVRLSPAVRGARRLPPSPLRIGDAFAPLKAASREVLGVLEGLLKLLPSSASGSSFPPSSPSKKRKRGEGVADLPRLWRAVEAALCPIERIDAAVAEWSRRARHALTGGAALQALGQTPWDRIRADSSSSLASSSSSSLTSADSTAPRMWGVPERLVSALRPDVGGDFADRALYERLLKEYLDSTSDLAGGQAQGMETTRRIVVARRSGDADAAAARRGKPRRRAQDDRAVRGNKGRRVNYEPWPSLVGFMAPIDEALPALTEHMMTKSAFFQ